MEKQSPAVVLTSAVLTIGIMVIGYNYVFGGALSAQMGSDAAQKAQIAVKAGNWTDACSQLGVASAMALDAKRPEAYASLKESETKACDMAKKIEMKKVQQELKSLGVSL